MNRVLLFNPRSSNYKPRIPNSILSIASSIEGLYDYVIVDGNLEDDPWQKIQRYLGEGNFRYVGITSMPGPQLKQAIPFSKRIRELFPGIKIIWGGYFPSNQPKVVLNSGFVDFIINGPGEKSFPALLNSLENNTPYELIRNIIYKKSDQIIKSPKDELYEQDELPPLPYQRLDQFYPLKKIFG